MAWNVGHIVYNHTDHLGNIRQNITKENGNLTVLREHNYYPFGLLHRGYNENEQDLIYDKEQDFIFTVQAQAGRYKYKFQGQERQEDLNLGWDSFKYRNYDYAIGRFFNVDPLAAKYPYNSTYAFQENKLGLGRELEGKELEFHKWLVQDATENPNGVGAHIMGFTKGVTNAVKNTYDAITNPKETLKGMANIMVMGLSQGNPARMLEMDEQLGTNSFETSISIAQGLNNSYEAVVNGDGFERGEVLGEAFGTIAIGEGIGAGLKGLGTIFKSTKPSPVQQVLNTINEIKSEGGQVKINPTSPNQELNLTIFKGNEKLDFRIETHVVPKKYGGNGKTPQRHMNVDLYPKKKNSLPNNGHKILEEK